MTVDPEPNMEQAILQAAERLFLEKGFAMTSTTEIAKAVGCNQALIHYYYRTKDNLFETIFERKLAIFLSNFLTIDETALSFEESLRKNIEAHFDMVRANAQLPFLIINELTTNPARRTSLAGRLSEIPRSILARIDSRLKVEIAEGRIRPISAFDLMFNIVALNAAFFLVNPIMRQIAGLSEEQNELLIEGRRRESVETILRSLRP